MKYIRPLSILVALALISCAGPPKTGLSRLYSGLADEVPRADPSILKGRRILVDPGHGGYFHGTMGRDSLQETHVNLGVSLYLWGLLREAGAEVYLTRSMDRDFLSVADSSLASDLQARVDMADSLEPDILISIHHNAQPQRNPDYNRVETYYRAGDPASLDLAFLIHRHLMRNLGIGVGEVRQGNYYILRNVDIPAVLGESSYLTHPPVEALLKLSDVQRLEAEAYFLGIVDYFSRGNLRVISFAPTDSVLTSVPELVYVLEDEGGLGVDPDAVEMRVNGQLVTAEIGEDGRRITYRLPSDYPNGPVEATLTARNLLGNTSSIRSDSFVIDHPPHTAVWSVPPAVSQGAEIVRIRARVLDYRGFPVADGTTVSVSSDRSTAAGIRTSDGMIDVPMAIAAGTKSIALTLAAGEKSFSTSLPRTARSTAQPIRALYVLGNSAAPVWSASAAGIAASPQGILYVSTDSATTVRAPGYIPVKTDTVPGDTLYARPWFGGVMLDRRFVIDPEGGRADQVGAGLLGLSASHVNLRVAKYLAGFLRSAGCEVWLTRENEELTTPEDVARRTNLYGASRYIELRHRSEPPDSIRAVKTFYFPGSRTGSEMAHNVASAIARRLQVPARPPSSTVTFPLQQTACPAIVIEAPAISSIEEELRLDQSRYLREQAYAIFIGILEHFSCPDTSSLSVSVIDEDPADWLVTVDGTWTLLTDDEGYARFEHLPRGRHSFTVRKRAAAIHGEVSLNQAGAVIAVRP